MRPVLYGGGRGLGRSFQCGHRGRQAHDKLAAFAGIALDVDGAIVGGNNPRHEAQAQAETLRVVGLRVADAIEAVEDVRQILGGDAELG